MDLTHVDGRAKLKALAGPLFARMPDGIYREMLADELAARVGMPAHALKEFFAAGEHPRGSRNSSEPTPTDHAVESAWDGAICSPRRSSWCCTIPRRRRASRTRGAGGRRPPGIGVLKELLEQAARPAPAQHRDAAGAVAGSARIRAPGRTGDATPWWPSALPPLRNCRWRSKSCWRKYGPGPPDERIIEEKRRKWA